MRCSLIGPRDCVRAASAAMPEASVEAVRWKPRWKPGRKLDRQQYKQHSTIQRVRQLASGRVIIVCNGV